MLEAKDLREREPYRLLAASIPLPLLVLGPEDEIIFANPASEQFWGTAAGILCGLRLADLICDGSQLHALVNQARRRDVHAEAGDVSIETPRGGRRVVDVSVAPCGGIAGAIVVILHQRQFAERINRQQMFRDGLRSLNGMAAVLAHEIKNPLSGIRGAAQLLEESIGERGHDLTRLICTETDRIRALIDSMETFGNGTPENPASVNIHEVLDRARAIARTGFARHAKFRDAFDPSLPPVAGNRDRLIQVFVNLLRNACDALPESGGEILLATAFRAGIFVERDGARRAVPLEVTVRDNGSGIAPGLLPHIFDPFVTTKPQGSGLGLALVTKIVGEHGGLVECDSASGRTEFRVLLPVSC